MSTGSGRPFEEDCLAVLRRIPAGDVMTYGEVAEVAGHPGAARAVGNLLRRTGEDVPWWRVVGAGGRLACRDPRQAKLLTSEGWTVDRGWLRAPPEQAISSGEGAVRRSRPPG